MYTHSPCVQDSCSIRPPNWFTSDLDLTDWSFPEPKLIDIPDHDGRSCIIFCGVHTTQCHLTIMFTIGEARYFQWDYGFFQNARFTKTFNKGERLLPGDRLQIFETWTNGRVEKKKCLTDLARPASPSKGTSSLQLLNLSTTSSSKRLTQ